MITVRICICIVVGICSQVQGADVVVASKTRPEVILKEVLPDELTRFQAAAEVGYNCETANAALALVNRSRALLEESKKNKDQVPVEERLKLNAAYQGAWEQVIKTWQNTTDAEVKAMVLNSWDSSLKLNTKDDDDIRRVQILALYNRWSPAFVSETFKAFFKETLDPMIIHAICRVFGQYGEYAEEGMLNEKRESLTAVTDTETTEYKVSISNIDHALKQISYWKQGDTARVGPAKGGRDCSN